MKNLYKKGGKVHPSPPPSSSPSNNIIHHLSLLPATILTLAAALSQEDKQVLAYLISCCGTTTQYRKTTTSNKSGSVDHGHGDHSPMFECNCFSCYMSFWARWDASSNRQVIHEIIEAYEERLSHKKRSKNVKKKNKDRSIGNNYNNKRVSDDQLKDSASTTSQTSVNDKVKLSELNSVDQPSCSNQDNEDACNKVELEKGALRKIVSFFGEKIGVLGIIGINS